ncbi:hypothetical protein NDU88_003872 [Pleurodeles waltl]|uniref:Uncharacterized protein n=1 Tax=Pleurodeles waltl TaxID=8319 RepID=A0AAV7WSW7_PLEWA|nr:hypothetical protein NDU88_003872 [Pleurodeles waltl]
MHKSRRLPPGRSNPRDLSVGRGALRDPGAGHGRKNVPRRSNRSPRPRGAPRHVFSAVAGTRVAESAAADAQVAGVAAARAGAMEAPGSRSRGCGTRRLPYFKFCRKGRSGKV